MELPMKCAVLVIAIAFFFFPEAIPAQTMQRVVVTTDAPLFITPTVRPEPLAIAEAGVVFKVVQVEGDWYLIEYEHARWGRRVGYIHKSYVKSIAAQAPRTSIAAAA